MVGGALIAMTIYDMNMPKIIEYSQEQGFEWAGMYDGNLIPLHEYVWSVPRTALFLYQMTTFDSISDILRHLTFAAGAGPFIFYLVHVAMTTFSVENLVTGMVMEATMTMQSETAWERAKKDQELQMERIRDLAKFFKKLDKDRSGSISPDEIEAALSDNTILALLLKLNITQREFKLLFELMDDGSKTLDADEFTSGCIKFFETDVRVQDFGLIYLRVQQLAALAITAYRDLTMECFGAAKGLSFGFTKVVQKSLPQFFDRVLAPREKGLRSIMPHPVNMGPYKEPLLQAVQPMEEKVEDVNHKAEGMIAGLRRDNLLTRLRQLQQQVTHLAEATKAKRKKREAAG
jgi:hypothetical protein